MSEQYEGVKFKTHLTKAKVANYRISELKYWCEVFYDHGLTPVHEKGSSGNLSFRLRDDEDRFVITAAGIRSKEDLKTTDFVLVESCDLDKKTVYARGMRDPSSESMLHFAIYKDRKDVHAVFHGHCNDILTQACSLHMPKTQARAQYGSPELVKSVREILGAEDFLVLKGHGFISLGKTLQEAGQRALTAYGRSLTLRDAKKR